MTKIYNWRSLLGILLVLSGGLALLQVLGFLPSEGSFVAYLSGLFFALGGLGFMLVMIQHPRNNWWAVIPGMVLLSISLLLLGGQLLPGFFNRFGGSVFLGGLALAFWVVFLVNRQNWWAIIPGGVLLTLAIIAGLESLVSFETGGVFFLGLAVTFALVAILPRAEERMSWAWIPAGVLFVIGMFVSFSATGLFQFIWPVALIVAGLVILLKTLRR